MDKPKYSWKGAEQFKRKPEIEADGTWFEFADGRQILISAATDLNPVWRSVSETFWSEWRRLTNSKALKRRRALECRHFAQYLFKDWADWLNADDIEIPFSREAAEAMLLELDDIYEQVAELVFKHQNFREARVKVIVDEGKESSTGE